MTLQACMAVFTVAKINWVIGRPNFDGHAPQGTVAFHEGFKADGLQAGALKGQGSN
jgi:hypothetical protein